MRIRQGVVAAAFVATTVAGTPAAEAHTYAALIAGGTYTGVIANGLTVAFDCTAAGAGDVVSVAITQCKLSTSYVNKTIALPGPTATTGGTATVPFAPFTLCYTAVFTFTDSHTKTLSGCNQLAPTAAGLPPLTGSGYTIE